MTPVKCGFEIAWYGSCKNTKPCSRHEELKCWECKAPATTECEVAGSLTCGMPECSKHSHAFTHYKTTK